MRKFKSVEELACMAGRELGVSRWLTVDRQRILAFANASGDDHWIHLDDARAARELPGGKIIAHGYLTLSLITALSQEIWALESLTHGLNYGLDKVRFLSPVPVDARVRLRQVLLGVEALERGHKVRQKNTIEIQGSDKPACVAETIAVLYEEPGSSGSLAASPG
jgi:acyl dehydratase